MIACVENEKSPINTKPHASPKEVLDQPKRQGRKAKEAIPKV